MNKKILFVTRQAGTVAAFEPLIQVLSENNWDYDILAFEKSQSAWLDAGRNINSDPILHEEDLEGVDIVCTGTSTSVEGDALYWRLAGKKGIPSIAFVDSWVNYHERFTVEKRFDRTPDYIALIDTLMAERMIENGAPEEKLVVVGHPRFDILHRKYSASKHDLRSNRKTIVIFTDPITVGMDDEFAGPKLLNSL